LIPQNPKTFPARLLIFAIISLTTAIPALAQSADRGWEWQNPRPQGNAISAIRFAADKRHGWAVGADGVILYTTDGGFQWESQHTRIIVNLNGLYVHDPKRAVVIGARGTVALTKSAVPLRVESFN